MSDPPTRDATSGSDDDRLCPWCGSLRTERIGSYASLLMTEQWFCNACSSPFERIRHRDR